MGLKDIWQNSQGKEETNEEQLSNCAGTSSVWVEGSSGIGRLWPLIHKPLIQQSTDPEQEKDWACGFIREETRE